MAESPFAPDFLPDQGQLQQMGPGPSPDMGESPQAMEARHHHENLLALAKVASLGAMAIPGMGIAAKGAKSALARYAAIVGLPIAGALGMDAAEAQERKGQAKGKGASGSWDAPKAPKGTTIPQVDPKTVPADPDLSPDEMLDLLQKREDLKYWKGVGGIGGTVKDTTQKQIDDAAKALEPLETERQRRRLLREGGVAREQKKEDEAAHEKKLEAKEGQVWNYRLGGAALGAGLGTALSMISRGRLRRASNEFTGAAGEIPNYIPPTPARAPRARANPPTPNVLTAPGGDAASLRSSVNIASEAGGARPPMGDLAPVYAVGSMGGNASAKNAALNTAKADFAATNAAGNTAPRGSMGERAINRVLGKTPNPQPFSTDMTKRVAKVPIADTLLPAVGYGEGLGAAAGSYSTDDKDWKDFLWSMGQAGLIGASAYKGARAIGHSINSGITPGQQALRQVQAGRNRLAQDVARVTPQDLTQHNAPPPPPTPPTGYRAPPGAPPNFQAIRAQSQANQALRNQILGSKQAARAHAASIDPATGQVNPDVLRQNLRQIYTARHSQYGANAAINDKLVRDLIKKLGSGPGNAGAPPIP